MKYLLLLLLTACAAPTKTEGFCYPKRIGHALIGIFLLAFVATSSRADAPEGFAEREIQSFCKDGLCMLREDDLERLKGSNQVLAERVKELEAQIKSPKCAKLEVKEPPRYWWPSDPPRRERDL